MCLGPLDRDSLGYPTADEWEVLAEKLEAGENYASKNGGIRLIVQRGSLTGPEPGPVRLHFSTQLLSCKGQDYFTNTIVHCPPDHRFEEPLLLDFFLDDPAVSNEKATLKQVFERYQVCYLQASHTWSIRESLELTRKVCWVAAQITLLT